MSRSTFGCRRCHHVLGYVRRGESLHVRPDVETELAARDDESFGLRITCPVCGQRRFFSNGHAVLPLEIRQP